MLRIKQLIMVGLFLLLTLPANPNHVHAQAPLCFPQTGQCIEGQFRAFWEQNGGLPVFGYPTSPARLEPSRDTGETYLTQRFERNRFELHLLSGNQPERVLLGRLGDDRLRQVGIDWQREPQASGPQQGCVYFAETKHNVCDQSQGIGFLTYWRTHGLNDPTLDPYGRSLALWGLPLTEPRMETNASGDRVLTQWFERARFEYHPAKPTEFRVLLGLLGVETAGGEPSPPRLNLYVALGDSLAFGLGATRNNGYVRRYWEYLQADGGTSISLHNYSIPGLTSDGLLQLLRTSQQVRAEIGEAGVVTWNIGGNDFADARRRYKARTCGGLDNQACLRDTLASFRTNWDAILAELRQLRGGTTLLRTMDGYNPYTAVDRTADTVESDGGLNDLQVIKVYVDAANIHIANTSTAQNIPFARVYAAFNGPTGDGDPVAKGYIARDGLHANDQGYQVMTDLLRSLGYRQR